VYVEERGYNAGKILIADIKTKEQLEVLLKFYSMIDND